jgi:hypothetical protein
VLDSQTIYDQSRVSVDNFVDILPSPSAGPDESRLCPGLPAKKARRESLMNQRLTIATGFVASCVGTACIWRTATQILCISQAWEK